MNGAIIAFIIGLMLVGMMTKKKPKTKADIDDMLRNTFATIAGAFNHDVAANIERIWRKETNDGEKEFTFQAMGAGMYAFGDKYPWGWNSMMKYWEKNPQYAPVGIMTGHDGWNKDYPMIIFPSLEAGLMTLGYFLNINQNNVGKWHSKDLSQQIAYSNEIAQIQNGYIL